jgi:hypothetical protein
MSGVADVPMGVSVEAHAQVVAMKAELVAELVAVKAELHGVRTDLKKLMTAVESIEAMVAARPGALATKTSDTGRARCSRPGGPAGLAGRRTAVVLREREDVADRTWLSHVPRTGAIVAGAR